MNDQIRARQVRLIGADGQQQGIIDTRDALQRARDADLDLVLVGENAQPPVARLLDYGKYRYELQQQAKEARKRSRQHEMKAIRDQIPAVWALTLRPPSSTNSCTRKSWIR